MVEQIHWYPGHMNKSLRELQDLSKNIDYFFLILDARAPKSSFINLFKELLKNKKIIILFNKADLVERSELDKWINFYKKSYEYVFPISFNNKSSMNKKLLSILDNIKFKSLIPKFMILGIPNVGKSTFLNNMVKRNKADVQNKPGLTRKINWYNFGHNYWILDTPGILEPKFEREDEGIILASIGSIKYEILPIDFVTLELLKIIYKKNGKNLNVFDFEDIEEDLKNKINNSRISEFDYYKKIIFDFQKGKFGKILLDDF